MKKLINKLMESSVFKFILVGGCSTGIDFFVYFLLSKEISITISKGISMCVASIFSYFVNKGFTFRNKEKTNILYLIKFYVVFVANLGTNLGVNYLVYFYTGYKLVAFAIATVCGMTVNYLGQKFFVFQRKAKV